MVDCGEVAKDVAAQNVGVPVPISLECLDGAVSAFSGAVGVAVIDEALFVDWADGGAERVMHHAIAEGRGGNKALLGFAHQDFDVAARPVGAGLSSRSSRSNSRSRLA